MSNTDDEIKPPKVTEAPMFLWLNYGDIERDCTHAECSQHGDVTWCEDSVFSSDVKYVRADALTAQAATIAAQARELEALRTDAERLREALADLHGQVKFHCDHYGEADFETDRAIAALQASETGGKARPHDNRKCSKPKCNGNMRPGTYLAQTMTGIPDFPGDRHAVTVSPGGPGWLAECLKCDVCGHSVTGGKAVTP